MALIQRFELEKKERQSVHRAVECRYSIFSSSDGSQILQLDTLGSPERKIAGKVSQSLQLSEASAKKLLEILIEAFPKILEDQR